ncbi:MAG: sensor histidine kinase/response regulator, partial [Moraxellaceae bacterium]|nr:sensor histidine kinase/response regulator [Moraxellaceae bacterium]
MLGSTPNEQRTGVRPADLPSRRPHGAARLFLLLGLLLLSLPLRAELALPIQGPLPATALEPYTTWHCDASGKLGPEAIRKQTFYSLEGRAVVFGFQPGACWFRFQLENRSGKPLPLLLQLSYPILDDVSLHLPGPPATPVRTGDLRPFASRPLDTRIYTFPFTLAPDGQQEFLLRVSSSSAMNVPLLLSSPEHYTAEHEVREWLNGLGFGILAGLLLYHLFLWLAVREKVFRFYVLYVGAAILYLLSMNGISYRFWPDAPDWNSHSQPFFLLLMLASSALFARDFLGPGRLPRGAELALKAVAALAGLTACLQFALPLRTVYPLQVMVTFPVIVTVLVATLSQLRGRFSETRIFLLSWLLLIAIGLMLALQSLGFFPGFSYLLSLKGLEVALILQQLMLALALADRLNSLKRERGEQQQAVLRAEAESAAKTEFLARMSHEIRTPLNALLGITELLDHTRLDSTQKNYVDTLGDSGQALLHVINDILDYSKISAGKVQLEQADFSLLDLLDECIRIFSLKAREKSLS